MHILFPLPLQLTAGRLSLSLGADTWYVTQGKMVSCGSQFEDTRAVEHAATCSPLCGIRKQELRLVGWPNTETVRWKMRLSGM